MSVLLQYSRDISNLKVITKAISIQRVIIWGLDKKLTLLKPTNPQLKPSDPLLKKAQTKTTFCSDCAIDWCKIRNQVSYCSQKYKGTSSYSCSDGSCTVRKIAGA